MARPTAYFLTESDLSKVKRAVRPVVKGQDRLRWIPGTREQAWIKVASLTPVNSYYDSEIYQWSTVDAELILVETCWLQMANGGTPELDTFYFATMVRYLSNGGNPRPPRVRVPLGGRVPLHPPYPTG